jgi:hypothetical protein
MLTGYETPKDLAGDNPDDVLFNLVFSVRTIKDETQILERIDGTPSTVLGVFFQF